MIRGVKMDKILMWIAIILIGLSGFSIKINSFEFEWLGLLETIIRIFKQFTIQNMRNKRRVKYGKQN